MHAVFIRAPWVESVGDGVEVLARVERRSRPTVGSSPSAQGRRTLLATSFHPELTGDARVHELFVARW